MMRYQLLAREKLKKNKAQLRVQPGQFDNQGVAVIEVAVTILFTRSRNLPREYPDDDWSKEEVVSGSHLLILRAQYR